MVTDGPERQGRGGGEETAPRKAPHGASSEPAPGTRERQASANAPQRTPSRTTNDKKPFPARIGSTFWE